MKKIKILKLLTQGGGNYIIEVSSIIEYKNFFGQRIFISGYIIDTDNSFFEIGDEYYFSIMKWLDSGELNFSNVKKIELLDEFIEYNIFDNLLRKLF